MRYGLLSSARQAFAFALCLVLVLVFPFSGSLQAATTDAQMVTIQRGKASFLSKKFHGRKTANGEIYHNYKLTAAHKKLPFGTVLRVTHLANGRSVIVRINDRGPFIKGRFVDLSRLAASKLNMLKRGVTEVQFEVITDREGRPLCSGEAFYIELGSGATPELAREAAEKLRTKSPGKYKNIFDKSSLFVYEHIPGYFFGLGPFERFEDAHKAFLTLPSTAEPDVICAMAKQAGDQ